MYYTVSETALGAFSLPNILLRVDSRKNQTLTTTVASSKILPELIENRVLFFLSLFVFQLCP